MSELQIKALMRDIVTRLAVRLERPAHSVSISYQPSNPHDVKAMEGEDPVWTIRVGPTEGYGVDLEAAQNDLLRAWSTSEERRARR